MAAAAPTPRPRFAPPVKTHPNVAGITAGVVGKWVPTFAIWGAGTAAAVALYASGIPLFQNDVLKKIPGVATYYKDTTPDSDKPF